jgi:hypothetical protein
VKHPTGFQILSAVPVTGPLLILTRHSRLNQLLMTRLVDDGHRVAVVMAAARSGHAFGSDGRYTVIPACSMQLRTVATTLTSGGIVLIAADAPHPQPGFTRAETSDGPWFIATQPMRLACSLGVPVAIAHHEIGESDVTSHLTALPHSGIEAMIAGYCHAFGLTPVEAPVEPT